MRSGAILITAILYASFEHETGELDAPWRMTVASIGLAHYMLSLIYARKQLIRLSTDQRCFFPSLLVAGACAALYLGSFPLLVLFGMHHVFNEVYSVGAGTAEELSGSAALSRKVRMVFHFFVYFAILRHFEPVSLIDGNLLLSGTVVTATTYFFLLFRVRRTMTWHALIDACSFEVMALGALALSFYTPVTFLAIVCYHFVLWCFLPLPALFSKNKKSAYNYIYLSLVTTAIFLLISSVGSNSYEWRSSLIWDQFIFWSYVHIISSLALSRSHPEWIRKWFWPSRPAATQGS